MMLIANKVYIQNHGLPSFTVSYGIVRILIIRFQIGDTSLRCGEMGEK